MAVNRRYLSSPWRQVSSLYRAAQSAKNLEDEEMKFKWDFEQISNEDYLAYVQKRTKEQTDPLDVMKWLRAEKTVKAEIRSDQRAMDFLKISEMGDNTSAKSYAKYAAYVKLANAAAADGDNDAFIAAQTAANNAWTTYENKLGSEARAGSASAVKTLTKKNQAELDAIATEEMDIKREFADDPLKMAALLGNLYIRKSKVNADMANALSGYEDKDNQIRDKARQAQKDWDKAVLFAEKVGIASFDKDANGNVIGFTPQTIVGPDGTERLVAGEGYSKVITPEGMKLVKDGKAHSISYDSEGNADIKEEAAPTMNNLEKVIDPDTGEEYFSEIQYNRTEPTLNTETGLYRSPMAPTASLSQKQIDKKISEGAFQDTRFIIDQQGHQRSWNPATNRFDLYTNRSDLESYAGNIGQKRADEFNAIAKLNTTPNTNINTDAYGAMLPRATIRTTKQFTDESGRTMTGAEYAKPLIGGTPFKLPEITGTQVQNIITPGGKDFNDQFFGGTLATNKKAVEAAKTVMNPVQIKNLNVATKNIAKAQSATKTKAISTINKMIAPKVTTTKITTPKQTPKTNIIQKISSWIKGLF